MKKITIIIVFFIVSISVFGQKERPQNLIHYDKKLLHFGFTVGLTRMDFSLLESEAFLKSFGGGDPYTEGVYSIENDAMWGFHLGPVSNLRLGEYFDLRLLCDLSFGQRNLNYTLSQDTANTYETEPYYLHTMKIESIFIEFPLLIKYKARRINNYRPYIIAGGNPKIDLAARKKIKADEMPKIKLNNFDVYGEIGFGIDYYLPYFKFSTEIKFAKGFMNMINHDNTPYSNAIERLNSHMVFISFHFE